MASHILERRVLNYAIRLRNEKKFPAFVSGTEFFQRKSVNKSGNIEEDEITQNLKIELLKFGKLKSKYMGSSIGCCAEARAANIVMTAIPAITTKDLMVAKAIRPKTLQEGKKCKICKTIFK